MQALLEVPKVQALQEIAWAEELEIVWAEELEIVWVEKLEDQLDLLVQSLRNLYCTRQ